MLSCAMTNHITSEKHGRKQVWEPAPMTLIFDNDTSERAIYEAGEMPMRAVPTADHGSILFFVCR